MDDFPNVLNLKESFILHQIKTTEELLNKNKGFTILHVQRTGKE